MFNYRPKLFDEASKSHASKKLYKILICFIVVFIVIALLDYFIPATKRKENRDNLKNRFKKD